MSKWTLTRKTQATSKTVFQDLRKGCFEMKVDHRKNQGATMFDFEKPIVKLQVEIRANDPSHDPRKRRSAGLALARDWSQKMIMHKNPGTNHRGVKGSF